MPKGEIFSNIGANGAGKFTLLKGAQVSTKHSEAAAFIKTGILQERRAKQVAETLSGVEQQLLAIARALMGRSEILLLSNTGWGLKADFTLMIDSSDFLS